MDGGWNHNRHYDDVVLRHVPSACGRSLDVGCGPGQLTRRIARRCGQAIGIDSDAAVIAAQGRSAGGNPQFLFGDVMNYPFSPASFDLITAVATLHHLPLEAGIRRVSELLKPGGVLVIVGLYRSATPQDYAVSAVAHLASWALRLTRATAAVGAPTRDPVETLAEIRAAVAKHLPGAVIQRRLLFRYTLIWTKPYLAH